ncbi:MAG: tRNA (adenosine(37)-N6)-threonylcarbamoyltransferase complex ATPase subunit type 1 TsaE [Marinilabiliaceae bacterium]|nr:tRNA (adenosine(37)-N6)-threonylcarbamoyltransferase complex ATPase subunit type 1 TsaE [Bacteroidales bacterium]MDD5816315.1 tRNA (adenosine(37)-N6)-threonylcarbamoyltransferase complex ATPase subunit type 1 TsaE [Bacteroidales bacterium]MDY4520068.1 tRNA (adenosine(37)-N6)-threonylcarbamoyltransferase complex ATPase subunit type 1 TsaE [Bacteroidales bacterium]
MQQFIAHNLDELESIAPKILAAIGRSRVVAMDAPMGAGKTTLVKALCKALGSISVVNSPTFAIINDYELPTGASVFHFDLYRLKNIDEAYNMGFDEYFYSGNYCFVEWPDIAADLFPPDTRKLTISVADDGSRTITIE